MRELTEGTDSESHLSQVKKTSKVQNRIQIQKLLIQNLMYYHDARET